MAEGRQTHRYFATRPVGPRGRRGTSPLYDVHVSAIVVAALVSLCVVPMANGQRGRGRGNAGRQQGPPVLIEPSAPIANLFSRADDGLSRSDWKFTIDCLQRIIDDTHGCLVPGAGAAKGKGTLHESARWNAAKRLGGLPPEGLRAYRLLYDGRAKRLFEQGRSEHNAAKLRRVVNRYVLTRYSGMAADLLVSWALDAGHYQEALVILEDFLAIAPRDGVPTGRLRAKLAATFALLGRPDRAAAVGQVDPGTAAAGSDPYMDIVGAAALLSPPSFERQVEPVRWAVVGGDPSRRGRMPAVKPTLLEHTPWRHTFAEGTSDAWRRLYAGEFSRSVVLPVHRAVADEDRLYVRTRRGCVALDREDLGVAWRVEDARRAVTTARRPTDRRAQPFQQTSSQSSTESSYHDHFGGEVALGHGLVLTASRVGTGSYSLADRDAGGQWSFIPRLINNRRAARRPAIRGTRLLAYEAQTGELRWVRGRTGDPNDPLGEVEFRSVPIAVGAYLWVPYLRQDDFYLAVLDPSDGAVIRRILLGSVRGSDARTFDTLPLAAADGMVYVPSGHGVLFAVDAAGFTLRWASQFSSGPVPSNRRRTGERATWLPGPPIVSGGLVLLAPTEHHALSALSVTTGAIEWSAPGGSGAYLIGADSRHVWVGGSSVSCLALHTGETVWSVDLPSTPTGRAVLSGAMLHVPMLSGLLTLDAVSGDHLDEVAAVEEDGPLGNLLCLHRSMFVVNASGVRKFPDIDRTYPDTVTALTADPTDLRLAVRLAWLELFRGDPQRAHDVLRGIDPGVLLRHPGRTGDVAHVRMEALLALADRSVETGRPNAEALALLEHANEVALRPEDRLRCGLAVADLLHVMGRREDAYRRLWEIGVGPGGEQVVSFGESVTGLARVDIARRMAAMASEQSDEEKAAMMRFAKEQTWATAKRLGTDDQARAAAARLRAIADLETFASVGPRALIALATYHLERSRFEQAEQLLRECIRFDSDPAVTITAMMRLCDLYVKTYGAGDALADRLTDMLDTLEARFGDFPVPAESPDATTSPGEDALGDTVAAWVERFHADVLDPSPAHPERSFVSSSLRFTGELAWSRKWKADPRTRIPSAPVPAELVTLDGPPGTALLGRVILHGIDDVVRCLDARDGTVLWEATLRLPQTFPERRHDLSAKGRRAVLDGQTLVVNGTDGLFALGMVTGRRLWIRPYEADGEVSTAIDGDLLLAAGEGFLAAMPKLGRLTLIRMLDGSTVWERDLRGERVAQVQMVGNRVLVIDGRVERVNVFDRADGRLIRLVLFRQPDHAAQMIRLVVSGGLLCGPARVEGANGISAVNLETGETAWSMSLDKPIVQVFKPAEGYVGVGMLGGGVRIIDVADGDFFERRIAGAQRVSDARLHDGTLLIQHNAVANDFASQRFTALDVATDKVLWTRDDVLSFARSGAAMHVVGGHVLAAFRSQPPPRNRSQPAQDRKLTMLDIRTGTTVGAVIPVPPVSRVAAQSGVFQVYPSAGVAVFGTNASVHAWRMETVAHQEQEGS